jgi:flagellar basal-body rod protein FlgF
LARFVLIIAGSKPAPHEYTMDNSIYVTLSRQLALFRDMDIVANNVANANTTAYNAEHLMFNSYLEKDINQGNQNPLNFAYNASSFRNTENGSIRITGNDLDIALFRCPFSEVPGTCT